MTGGSELPPLRVELSHGADTVVLRLDGELDCATAPKLAATLEPFLGDHQPRRLLVDAERLAFADVSGLAPLIDAAESLRPHGTVTLRKAGRNVTQIVQLLGLQDLIELAD